MYLYVATCNVLICLRNEIIFEIWEINPEVMKNSIGIIGMGWVGSSVAISILQRGICKELLLSDVRTDIAEGEAMDLNHGSSFFPSASVRAASIADMKDCRAIVITAGKGGKPGQSRLDLLNDNLQVAKAISAQLIGFQGLLIIVANPVDVLTYFYQKFTGLPANQVIGTGTFLDSARLKDMIGDKLNVDPQSIHAQVVGEHGDSSVVLWSRAAIGNTPIREWTDWKSEYEPEIEHQVRRAAGEIIKRKGSTNHAIGLVTATLLKWLLRGDRRIVTLSKVLEGENGYSDVAISLPVLIGDSGIERVLDEKPSAEEKEQLNRSVKVIKQAISSVSK
jgi:L-lactate dehydrogenase